MHQLKAQPRQELGKKVKSLRKKGLLPAVVYGEGVSSQPIAVSYKDFERAYQEAGESTLVTLELGEKSYNVLIHEISRDPLKGVPIHTDFYAVRMDKEIRVSVPLVFAGESPAVENEGGVLIKVVQELEVEALPQNLPHELAVDLSRLVALESRLTVADIPVPSGVKVLADADEVVVVIEKPRSEEELKALEQAPVAEAAPEVKTEQELKREAAKAQKGEETEKTEAEKT